MRRRDELSRDGAFGGSDVPPPHAALDDPPPPPPRNLKAIHRALTLVNVASSYATEHLERSLLVGRLEGIRRRLAQDHPPLAALRVEDDAQVSWRGDGDEGGEAGAERSPDALIQGTAAWVRELFEQLERGLPGRFATPRLRAITEAIYDDMESLGFYAALGLDDQETTSR